MGNRSSVDAAKAINLQPHDYAQTCQKRHIGTGFWHRWQQPLEVGPDWEQPHSEDADQARASRAPALGGEREMASNCSGTVICPQCGAVGDGNFCTNCGVSLKTGEELVSKEVRSKLISPAAAALSFVKAI